MTIWKKIKDYDGYMVSNYGDIKSNLRSNNKNEYKVLKQFSNSGYRVLSLVSKDGPKMVRVHRLVAFAFCEGHFDGAIVNHIDGNKSNNDFDNLEWCSQSENIQHAHDNKFINQFRTYSDKEELEIINLGKQFYRVKDIKEIFPSIATIAIQRILKKNNLGFYADKKKQTSKFNIIEKKHIKKVLTTSKRSLKDLCLELGIERRLAGKIRNNQKWQNINIS